MVQRCLIIADDLTGGADTGTQFAKRGLSTLLISLRKDPRIDFSKYIQRDVLVVNTNSRGLAPEKAFSLVSNLIDMLGTEGIEIEGEILKGIVKGHLIGENWDGVTAITKAGAFGKEDALEEIVKSITIRTRGGIILKCKEKHVPGRSEWEQSRGAFEDWIDPDPPKYWKTIVVSPENAAPTVRKDGQIATQIGQLGYSLISSKTVNSLTLRVGVAELPMGTGEEVGYHWHNCEEVLYIMQGSGWVDVEGERQTFKEGDALFFPFRAKHRTWMSGDKPVRFVFIVGIRLRPYEGLTESSIDYREYCKSEE